MHNTFTRSLGVVRYPYINQLKQLDSGSAVSETVVPAALRRLFTPLVYSNWAKHLKSHPDAQFWNYILEGIINNFHTGFDLPKTQ